MEMNVYIYTTRRTIPIVIIFKKMSEQLNILNQDPTVEKLLRDPTVDMTEEITQGPSKYTIW